MRRLDVVERSRDLDAGAAMVEFFFSPGSRYSYLAASRLPGLEAETGCRVQWRSVRSTDLIEMRGSRNPFDGSLPSGQYDWDYRRYDAECWADLYGIPFCELRSHEVDFGLLARAAMAAQLLEVPGPLYAWPLCRSVYGEGRWPLDRALCLELAERADVSRSEFEALLDGPRSGEELHEAAVEAHERGAFGVPTFFVGERLFWGNDRLPLVRHALMTRS